MEIRHGVMICISALLLAAAIGFAAASRHLLRPPPTPSPLAVVIGTVTGTDKDPL